MIMRYGSHFQPINDNNVIQWYILNVLNTYNMVFIIGHNPYLVMTFGALVWFHRRKRIIWEHCTKHNVFCELVNHLFKSVHIMCSMKYLSNSSFLLLGVKDIQRKNYMKKLPNGVEQKHPNPKNRLNIEH